VRDGTSVTVADHGVPIGTILPMRFTERTMELDRQGRGTLPKADASAFRLTEVDAAVVAGAGELAAWHGLAALDAIHLGSAADVATGTRPFAFVTFDRRLAAAALAEGLTVLPEVA
jgi:predicted nucleic acid-binding protein